MPSSEAAVWNRIATELEMDDGHSAVPRRMQWTIFPDTGPSETILEPYRSARVIELGCGDGSNSAFLATAGAKVTAVDFSAIRHEQNISRWRAVRSLTFVLSTAEDLYRTFPPSSSDIALSIFGALQFGHVPTVLRSVRHVLVPGGRLVFSVRALEIDQTSFDTDCLEQRDFAFTIPGRLETNIRMWRGTIRAWIREVEKHGFSVTDAVPTRGPELVRDGEYVAHTYVISSVLG
jgi:SAM-dependent methyltransferase